MENTSASAGSTSTVSSSAATFGKRWRDKLRNKDKKNDKPSLDAVVNDFLGAHRRGQTSQGGNADAPSGPPPYDVANYVPKAPRRPGLQVSFSLQPPAIIGEGGDDCEIPTAHLATTRRPSPKEEEKRPSDADRVSEDNNAQPSVVVSGGANDELGFDDSWRPPLTSDTTLLRALSSAGTGSRRTRLSMRVDDETADLARKIRAKMMEEEGRALHQKPPEVEEDTTGRSTENKDPPKDGDGNIIAAPQPRRVFTYRPSEESANLETLEKRSAEHEQQSPFRDSASSGEDGGAHIQNIISHLRDEDSSQLDSPTFETASERDHAPEPQPELEHKHTLPYRSPENFEPPSQPVPSSPPRLPAFNPLDLSMSTSPRRRDNDRPVSPIKSEASSPPRVDLLTSPPRSSHSNLQPQPQYQHEHSPSASPAPRHLRNQSSQSNVRMVPPRQPSGGMSRSNTTARPRPQPSQDTLVSRSMSMRAGSNQRPFEKGSPSLSNGWQKPQYMPAPSPAPSSISAPRQRPRVPEVAEPPEGERTNDYHKSSSSVSSSQNGTNSLKPFPLSRDVSKDSVPRAVDHSPPSSSSSTLPSYQDSSVSVLTEKTIPPSQPAEQEQHHSPPTPPQPQTQKPVSQPQSQSAAPKKNWRALTSAVTQNALSDFTLTAKQYYDIFEASAQDVSSHLSGVEEKGLTEWIRTSVWWVLKGRSQLEAAIRNPTAAPVFQKQGAVNLAKAWWINNEVVPTHAELSRLKQQISNAHGDDGGDGLRVGTEVMLGLARNLGDARMSSLITLHQTVSSHIRALATSMKRNNINLVPPVDLQEGELDTSIWLHYPYFGADVTALLSTLVPRTLRVDQRNKASDIDIGELMPFADTSRFFNYGRMFVTAVVQSDDDDDEDIADARNQEMRCVLSLARERSEWHIQAFIASQNNLVNLVIQSDKRQGPTWHDVRFDSRHLSMKVRLSRGWKLEIRFTGMDGKAEFERLWKMVEHTRKVEAGLNAEEHETVAFESVLKAFQYVGSPGAAGAPFPTEPTQRCRIRLFEKQVPMPEANGTRFAHMGYRMICVTSPKVKNLSSLSHSFTHSSPIIFAHARSKDDGEDSPILLLKLNNKSTGAPFQVRLTFHESGELSRFHALLLSVALHRSEEKTPDIPMRSFSIEDPTMATRSNATFIPGLVSFPGQVNGPAVKAGVTVSVINTTPDLMEHGRSRTVGSNNLRLFVKCGWGSVTDRMNLGPGEMKLNLDPQAMTTMSLYRGGQHDLTVSYADNLAPTESRETISRFLKAAGSTPTIRKFHFNSVRELHEFEHALTGFNVLFDGLASVLTISRRRMVVPIYKKWEALGVRLQIVQQEKAIQLLAFFSDFAHGKCMNFAIKGTDVFETVSRSGKYGVRIVDAKFPLPKRAGQPVGEDSTLRTGEEEYLCLDLPDFPSEHDDIMIWFDDEQVWKEFQTAVPGIIREASKIGSLRH